MKSGTTSPASSKGMPKMSATIEPPPSVRLMTRPAIKRSRPMAMANEKLKALSGLRLGLAAVGSLALNSHCAEPSGAVSRELVGIKQDFRRAIETLLPVPNALVL